MGDRTLKRFDLHLQILTGIVLGGAVGFFLTEWAGYVSWIGELFLRALRMLIVPLVLTSIASGVISIARTGELGRLGLKTLAYYATTSVLAAGLGLTLVNLVAPGRGASLGFTATVEGLDKARASFGSTLTESIPPNIFAALAENEMLPVLFVAFIFGYTVTRLEHEHREFLTGFVSAGFALMMKLTLFVIRLAPVGVFAIIAGVVARQAGDLEALTGVIGRLGLFAFTVFLGLALHAAGTLALLLRASRIPPLRHARTMMTPLLTAFSTASSSATLPLTLEKVEKDAGVSNKVTSFVLPLGATINMDGTALYECVAAIFIAQAYGVELSLVQQIIIVATALLVSVGAAGIPMAGLVMMSVVLTAVGLPLEGIGLVLAVEWILGMTRTVVNVWSDSCGAVIIARSEGEQLAYDEL